MRILVLDTADGRARMLARSLAADLGLPLVATREGAESSPSPVQSGVEDGYVLLGGPDGVPASPPQDGVGGGPELVLSLEGTPPRARRSSGEAPEEGADAAPVPAERRLRTEGTDAQLLAAARRIVQDLLVAREPDGGDDLAAGLRNAVPPPEPVPDLSAPGPGPRERPESTSEAPPDSQSGARSWKQAAERKGKLVRGHRTREKQRFKK